VVKFIFVVVVLHAWTMDPSMCDGGGIYIFELTPNYSRKSVHHAEIYGIYRLILVVLLIADGWTHMASHRSISKPMSTLHIN